MTTTTGKKKGVCAFCGFDNKTVGKMVQGGTDKSPVFICSNCVRSCSEALDQDKEKQATKALLTGVPLPRDLYNHLNLYVIGQDAAKRQMSVEISNHYQRVLYNEANAKVDDPDLHDVEIDKANMLMIGPTGSGKTLLAKSVARKLDVPFAIGDATTLTEAGYVGEDVENLLLKLLHAADFDVEAAQRGIIYIDEIDKLRKTGGNTSITRDVSGEGVQQSLLKLIEGTIANVPPQGGRKHPDQQYIQIDTRNILFIVGGAFVGLDEIIGKRLNQKRMGFGAAMQPTDDGEIPPTDEREHRNWLLKHVTPDDLIEFGLIPEFVGRLPVLASLDELSVEDMRRVLVEPKNSLIKQERLKMKQRGYELEFTDDGIDEIVAIASKKGTGARSLQHVIANVMTPITFNLDANVTPRKIVIDREVVIGEKKSYPAASREAA